MAGRTPPKPPPAAVAIKAFNSVCGIASAPWSEIPPAVIQALREHSYLRDKTLEGAEKAKETVRQALVDSGLIPLGGDIDGALAPDVATLALLALARTGQLTDRAKARMMIG